MSTPRPKSAATPGPDYQAAFASVVGRARPLTEFSRLVASDAIEDFVDACETGLQFGLLAGLSEELLPGVEIPSPDAVLKAYLLFVVNIGAERDGEISGAEFGAWYESVSPSLWQLLGFEKRPPTRLRLALAFSLLEDPDHHAPEVRGLVWLVRDLAASGLLPALRS